jgi:hypothetical protein
MATLITNSDLGNSLLILGDKLEVKEQLKGNNYIVVYGNLLNTLSNGTELVDKLTFAKTLTPNGQLLSDTNRVTVLVAPGKYDFFDTLEMDTPYVDLISLTGKADVFLTTQNGNTAILVDSSDISIKGFNLGTQNIKISNTYFDNYFENIIGGDYNFSNGTFGGEVAGNFKNCKGGAYSFGDSSNQEYLLKSGLENCQAEFGSFGYQLAASELKNCLAGAQSFGFFSIAESILNDCESGMESFGCEKGIFVSTLTNCTADGVSFGRTDLPGLPGQSTIIETSQLNNCKAGDNSFSVKNSDDSSFINCVGGDESFGTDMAISIYKNCKGGNNSFGAGTQGWSNLIAGGNFYNCEAGIQSFGTNESTGNFYYCKAGNDSFLGNAFGKFTGNAYFTTGMNPSYLAPSILAYCLDWNNNPINNLNTTTNNI